MKGRSRLSNPSCGTRYCLSGAPVIESQPISLSNSQRAVAHEGAGLSASRRPLDVGHRGGFLSINSNLDMFLDSDYTAVVMSDYDRSAQPVKTKIRELIAVRE